jgi:hypothetical protein
VYPAIAAVNYTVVSAVLRAKEDTSRTIPKAPPALVAFVEGAKNPAASNQKVMSRKKKRDASAMEDLRDAMRKMKVTILEYCQFIEV